MFVHIRFVLLLFFVLIFPVVLSDVVETIEGVEPQKGHYHDADDLECCHTFFILFR